MPSHASFRLRPPEFPNGLVYRARLLDELRLRFDRRLTVVRAGAGFGKTTLLAHAENVLDPVGTDVRLQVVEPDRQTGHPNRSRSSSTTSMWSRANRRARGRGSDGRRCHRSGVAARMRTPAGLDAAGRQIEALAATSSLGVTGSRAAWDATNVIAAAVASAATAHTNSRGCHRRADDPHQRDEWRTRPDVGMTIDGELAVDGIPHA